MQPLAGANRFDALRLAFASAVVVYHLFLLSGLATEGSLAALMALGAKVGVQGFFVISGALVYRSLTRSPSLSLYAEKRARRILPAYFVIIALPILAALTLSIAAGALAADSAAIARYAGANFAFLNFIEPTLPHLFTDNPMAEVNGALWTIKVEVAFYLALPVLSFVLDKAGARKWAVLALVYVCGEAWRIVFETLAAQEASRFALQLSYQLPGQMAFFASGVAIALAWERTKAGAAQCALIGAPLFLLSLWPPLEGLRAAGLASLIAAAAFAPGQSLPAARWGDLSYGVYICHFPIIQAVIASGLFKAQPTAAAIACLALTVAAALAMWRFVEAPALRKDSHYHLKTQPAPQ